MRFNNKEINTIMKSDDSEICTTTIKLFILLGEAVKVQHYIGRGFREGGREGNGWRLGLL